MKDRDRCELTELYVRQCAHCRRLPDPKTSMRLGAWLTALYPGRCVGCDDYIDPGDQIRSTTDGYVCADCGLDLQ